MKKIFLIPTFLLFLSISTLGQTQLIQNGNFSNLDANWSVLGPYWFVSNSFTCYSSATAYAYTGTASGGGANNTYGSINQTITIPANALSATLTFKTSISTDEISTIVDDILEVQLRDPSLNLLYIFVKYSNLNGVSPSTVCQAYQSHTFNVPSSYFGQPLLLNFQTASDGSLPTRFRIDDVSLTYQPAQTGSPVINVSGNLSFGNVQVGSTSQRTMTIANTGNATLNVSSINYPTGFTGNWSNGNISAGGSRNVTVTFTPTAASSYGGTIAVNSNATSGTSTIPCSGTGITSSVPTINVTGNLDFGNVQVGTASQNIMTISNASNATLSVSSINYPSGFTGNWSSGSISAGGSQNVTVTFSPTSASSYGGTITVNSNATSGTSTISCSGTGTTVTSPTVNSITFTNVIENHPGIAQNFTLYSGSPTVTNNPIKICADGSTATYIAVNVSNISGINFRILDELGNIISDPANNIATNPSKFGQLGTSYPFPGNNVEVAYTHPQYTDASGLSRLLKLEVLHNGNPISGISFPLEIYRAPIVFVHGFWGNNMTFENLRDNLVSDNLYPSNSFFMRTLNYNGSYTSNGITYTCSGNCSIDELVYYNPIIHLIDYKQTNGKSFSFNARKNIVANGIDSVFKTARLNNYSSGKVILIGHSMGGVLSRLYLQSTYHNTAGYKNYRFDIQKLITINTPHYGTQFSDWVLDPLNNRILNLIKIDGENLSDKIGAISDFKVHSNANTHDLNIPLINQNKIPTHTISTIVTEPLVLNDHKIEGILLKSLLCSYNLLQGWYSCKDIFNSEANDEIVPLISQKGGFNWSESDYNRFHVGSTRSTYVQTEVKNLINSNPFSSNFSNSGFAQNTLNYNYRLASYDNSHRLLSDSIKILNITSGQLFNEGDSIDMFFSNTSGINNFKAYLTGGTNSIFKGNTSTSNSDIKFKLDIGTVGGQWIYLLGYDSSVFRDLDSVYINISTAVQLDSIKILPRNIILPVGYNDKISINGYYSDGIVRELRSIIGLTFQFDTTKISVDSNYKITGKAGPFKILLSANYLNKNDTILVETTLNSTNNISDLHYDKNIICAGSQIKFFESSLGAIQSRLWKFPGGSPNTSTLTNPSVIYTAPGFYDVTLITTFPDRIDTLTVDSLIEVNAKPSPQIMGPTFICAGNSAMLDAGSGYSSYLWSDGTTTQNNTILTPGNYSVTVTDENGCSATSPITTVTVSPLPTATITSNGVTTFCQGNSVTLTASAAGSYLWSDGATTQNNTVLTSGNYSVTVTDGNGCSETSPITTVTVNPLPAATITPGGTTTFCQGNSVTLMASAANSYLWSDGTTTQSNIVSSAGNYSVTVTDGNGCSATSPITIVTGNSFLTATITPGGATTFCQGNSVTLTASAASSYLWSDGKTTQNNTVSSAGNYSVTIADGNGCSATSPITTVTVNSLPTATITQDGATTFCEGNSVTLTASEASSYLWSDGATTQNNTISSTGNYSVTVTDGNGCSATSAITTITVNPLPPATITPGSTTTLCQGNSVTLTASEASSYLWSNGTTTQSNIVSSAGNYSVTITDGNGCSATSPITTITVNPLPTATVTPGGATTFCEGNFVTLTSSTANSYLWSDGATTQNNTVLNSGNYSVTVTDGSGCSAISSITIVTVHPLPTATIFPNGTTTFCQGNSVTLTASASSSYLWSDGTTEQSNIVLTSGNYSVTVTNGNGCSATSPITNVTVNPTVVPTIKIQQTSCNGNTVNFNSNITGGGSHPSYLWTVTGSTQTGTESTFTVANATTGMQVKCTLISNETCAGSTQVSSTSLTITIPDVSISGELSFCQNTFTILKATGAATYQWSNGLTAPSIIVRSPGTYSVKGISSTGCADTASVQISMLSIPVINLDANVKIDRGTNTTLGHTPVATGAMPFSYEWTPSTWLDSDISANPVASPRLTTTYTVKVTDKNGCSNTKSIEVLVKGFYVFPNPSNDIVNIYGSVIDNGKYTIRLSNQLGQIVLSEEIQINSNSMNKQISISKFSSGIYYLSIESMTPQEPFKIIKL